MITAVFVYGTLQRGQCRGRMWPCRPLAIEPAYVRGRLFDLGAYPALRCDDDEVEADWVAGEVWSFAAEDMSETIATLDQIEETNQPGRVNLYDRVLVRAHQLPDALTSLLALAYQYSTLEVLTDDRRLRCCGDHRYVAWPPTGVTC